MIGEYVSGEKCGDGKYRSSGNDDPADASYRQYAARRKIGQKGQSRGYYVVLVVLHEQEMKKRLLVCYPLAIEFNRLPLVSVGKHPPQPHLLRYLLDCKHGEPGRADRGKALPCRIAQYLPRARHQSISIMSSLFCFPSQLDRMGGMPRQTSLSPEFLSALGARRRLSGETACYLVAGRKATGRLL